METGEKKLPGTRVGIIEMGLDLIDRVHGELWAEACDIVQEIGIKTSPRKRNAKKQNGCLRRPYKELWKERKPKAKEKRKDIPI